MRLLVLTLLVIVFSQDALAGTCYSQVEAEADQGIRIHSELMVIGLNCQSIGMRHGDNLYGTYRAFTSEHADLFSKYEQIMLRFFGNLGEGNPEASLNTLRTKYANKISNDAAGMRPDVFCSTYAPRIFKAAEMEQRDVRVWAATIFPSHPVSYPLCEG